MIAAQSLFTAHFLSETCVEDDAADCSAHAFAEHLDEKQLVVGTVCSTGVEDDVLPAAVEAIGQSDKTELEGHEYNVQLLEKRSGTVRLPATFETDDTTTESRQQRNPPGLSTVADVQRNSSSLGKGQRRNLSRMTKVLSMVFAAAQHLDSSCTDCWNRKTRSSGGVHLWWKLAKAQAEKACELASGTDMT